MLCGAVLGRSPDGQAQHRRACPPPSMSRAGYGYIIAFGDALYRANDAAQRLRASGIDVGLINKSTLNILDEETTKMVGSTGFALVVEPLSSKTGLGSKYGYWLAKLNLPKMPVFDNIGINKGGEGGLWEHAYEQGYDSVSIQ